MVYKDHNLIFTNIHVMHTLHARSRQGIGVGYAGEENAMV